MKRRMFFAGVAAVLAAPKALGLPRAAAAAATEAFAGIGGAAVCIGNMRAMFEAIQNQRHTPRVLYTTPALAAQYEFEINEPYRDKARRMLGLARDARLAGDHKRAVMYQRSAAGARWQAQRYG